MLDEDDSHMPFTIVAGTMDVLIFALGIRKYTGVAFSMLCEIADAGYDSNANLFGLFRKYHK